MGSVNDEPGRLKNEVRHQVRLTRPFALLDREITFEELIAFHPRYIGFMRQYDAKPEDAGFGVDWYDAVGFCRWLGQQMGLAESDQPYADPATLDKEKYPREPNPDASWAPRNWPVELGRRGFRLPTEAEWEAASRAGARTAYGYGGDVSLLGRFGWFVENSGKHVHPPRGLRPGRRGLFDLHGNLFEWTHDWYGDYDTKTSADPLGPDGGSIRVSRGGGWGIDAALCRAAHRDSSDPAIRSTDSGFRLALSPSGVPPEAGKGNAERSHQAEARRERGGAATGAAGAGPRTATRTPDEPLDQQRLPPGPEFRAGGQEFAAILCSRCRSAGCSDGLPSLAPTSTRSADKS